MGHLSVYNLGKLGVNVDKSPVHLDDGELTKAQNAIHDPIGGVDGALKNRPGLVKYNSSTFGSVSVLGGVNLPISGFGSSAGGSSTTPTLYWTAPAILARSTNLFSTATALNTPSGAVVSVQLIYPNNIVIDTNEVSATVLAGSRFGRPGVFYNNRFYFHAAATATGATTGVGEGKGVINVYDGTATKRFAQIPYNQAVYVASDPLTFERNVTSIYAFNGSLYLTTCDNDANDTTFVGRVFRLHPDTGQLTQIGTGLPAGYIPWRMAFTKDTLFVGLRRQTITNSGRVYSFRLDVSTTWALETTFAANLYAPGSMAAYKDEIFVGTYTGSAGTAPLLYKRSTTGTWTTSDTGATTIRFNGWPDMALFKDKLYATYFGSLAGNNLIREYDGTSWTTRQSGQGNSGGGHWVLAAPTGGRLYAAGSTGTDQTSFLSHSTNGTSWTDVAASGLSAIGIGTSIFGELVI